MNHADRHPALSGPGMMLLSAAIFGYFGFTTQFNYHSVLTGEFLLFVALLDWTLKGTTIAFGLSALLTFVNPLAGNLLYSIAGIVSAIMLLVVAGLDTLDKQHTVISPIILLFFAVWNGIGSWQGLKTVLALRAMKFRSRETADFPGSQ